MLSSAENALIGVQLREATRSWDGGKTRSTKISPETLLAQGSVAPGAHKTPPVNEKMRTSRHESRSFSHIFPGIPRGFSTSSRLPGSPNESATAGLRGCSLPRRGGQHRSRIIAGWRSGVFPMAMLNLGRVSGTICVYIYTRICNCICI